jgi:hypothetical protein
MPELMFGSGRNFDRHMIEFVEFPCKLSCSMTKSTFWGENSGVAGEEGASSSTTSCPSLNSYLSNIFAFSVRMCEVSSINKQRWWKEAIVYQVCVLITGGTRQKTDG